MILPVHILAGGLALVFGYVALYVVLAVARPRQTNLSWRRSRQRA
jgi:hypothetical protein